MDTHKLDFAEFHPKILRYLSRLIGEGEAEIWLRRSFSRSAGVWQVFAAKRRFPHGFTGSPPIWRLTGFGFILVGVLCLIPGEQTNLASLGLGTLLLGLNLVRVIRRILVSYFSIMLGVIFRLVWIWGLISPALGLSLQIELVPILLIALWLYLLIPSPERIITT